MASQSVLLTNTQKWGSDIQGGRRAVGVRPTTKSEDQTKTDNIKQGESTLQLALQEANF